MRQARVLAQGRHDVLLLAVGPTRGAEPDGLHVDDLCPVRALVPAGAEAHRRDRARVVASPPPAAAPVVSRISVPSAALLNSYFQPSAPQ